MILDSTLHPEAQCVFNSFVWGTQMRYGLTEKEVKGVLQLVSDKFVQDFSLACQASGKDQCQLAAQLEEVHMSANILDHLGQPGIMLVDGGQTLPVTILASQSVEENKGWEALCSEILHQISGQMNKNVRASTEPPYHTPASRPSTQLGIQQAVMGPTALCVDTAVALLRMGRAPLPSWKMPDPLAVSQVEDRRLTVSSSSSIHDQEAVSTELALFINELNLTTSSSLGGMPMNPPKIIPPFTRSATSSYLTEFDTVATTRIAPSIQSNSARPTATPSSTLWLQSVTLSDQASAYADPEPRVSTQRHCCGDKSMIANLEWLTSSSLSRVPDTQGVATWAGNLGPNEVEVIVLIRN
ncbi:uncharacterized protein EI90DRAFT_3018389 [Cantharellus anzutake]|uniref:uncharacterized protein n=1 Tax=Cantharellus anzutake TaxID=1750568 RepID=UPI0019060B49|nr:uncharacterized protein EI90DRAFT_3018389 [Cantharellus anzutake]KAF8327017.1 hypothetical protein EI90DRAFT_3018389 [Cantharellus anzutake]